MDVRAARRAAGHLVELATEPLRSRLTKSEDSQALLELERASLDLPAGLELEWIGVSGYRLTYEGQTIYIDPYVSRVPFSSLVRRRQAVPDPAALERFLPRAGNVVGVLVGHTHFDHAVDAPAVAREFGCPAYGSGSLARLMGLHELGHLAVEVEPYRTYEIGPFGVSFTPSAHSKLLLGLAVPMAGELTCDHLDSLSPSAYKCGQVWGVSIRVAGTTFYHQGSANLIDDALRERDVDVFLAGIAGRSFTERYWERILPLLDPRYLVPTHYDNFFKPLGEGMDLVTNVKLSELPDEVHAVSRDATIATMPRHDRGA